MRGPRLSAVALIAASVFVGEACGPAGQGPTPTAAPPTGPAATLVATPSPAAVAELVAVSVWSRSISVGVPTTWVVLDQQGRVDLEQRLRPIAPELADMYSRGYSEGVAAVDLAVLPDAFSGLSADYSCSETESAADRLEQIRHPLAGEVVEAAVVDLPAGEVATVSIVHTLGSFRLRFSLYSFWAPTTDCNGELRLMVTQSEPDPALVDAIARSVRVDSSGGVATLELRDSVVLPLTEFPVVCEIGGETGDVLRMSSGTAVKGLTLDLGVDRTGQPVFFQFANGTLMYFSGKGFEASETFVPEPQSAQARGAATFQGILPPDDPANPLSGRVSWDCEV